MSGKNSINVVSQRVQKTKREIEDLKAELERLINCGIKKDVEEKRNEPVPIAIEKKLNSPKSKNVTTSKNVVNTNNVNNLKSNSNVNPQVRIKKRPVIAKENPPKDTSPNRRVRRYNPEEAREYIKKKRKERSIEKTTVKNNTNVKSDMTKQRLKELHKKSLDLVTKNVQIKRERSRSREPNKNSIIARNVNFTRGTFDTVEKDLPDEHVFEIVKHQDDNLEKIKAAIKIQAFYRGFKARRSYKEVMSKRKIENERLKQINEIKSDWLNINVTPLNPYNFINTVKRKLNLATREFSDVSVQNTFVKEVEDGSSIIRKTKEDIKELFERTVARNVTIRSTSKEIVISDSDTSKNIPDIATESSSTVFEENNLSLSKLTYDPRKSNSIISSNKSNYDRVQKKSHDTSLINKTENNYLREFVDYMKDYGKTPKKTDNNRLESNSTVTSITEDLKRSHSSLSENNNRTKTFSKSSARSIGYGSVKHSKSSSRTENVTTASNQELSRVSGDWERATRKGSINEISPVHLVPPDVKLSDWNESTVGDTTTNVRNLKSGEKTTFETTGNTNQIHLKFEAELHLLNDFNESLRQFMAVDKTLLELQNKNSSKMILHTRDTQTSFASNTSILSDVEEINKEDVSSKLDDRNLGLSSSLLLVEKRDNSHKVDGSTTISTSFDNENDKSCKSTTSTNYLNLINDESNLIKKNVTLRNYSDKDDTSRMITLSRDELLNNNTEFDHERTSKDRNIDVDLFDQFIRDEDARLDNLKTILKIREKTLLDRTKAELAWLEIQKKHLKETGHTHEVSLVKKKQRGILLKLQQERHEMHRLKQMQKIASKERKIILKQQRNLIKGQLSTNNMMSTKIKRNVLPEQRRLSGPLKVYNIKTSETSIISKQNSSMTEELISVTSRTQSLAAFSNSDNDDLIVYDKTIDDETIRTNDKKKKKKEERIGNVKNPDQIKRSLLMREEALHRRRKAAEELLQWHQRLVEEEKKIQELETTANKIIQHISSNHNHNNNNKKNDLQDSIIPTNALLWHNNNIMTTRNISSRIVDEDNKQEDERSDGTDNQKDHSTDNVDTIVTINKTADVDDGTSSVRESYSFDFNTEKEVTMECVTSSLHQIKETLSNISNEISEIQELSITNSNKLSQTNGNVSGGSIRLRSDNRDNVHISNRVVTLPLNRDTKIEDDEVIRTSNGCSSSERETEMITRSSSRVQLSNSSENTAKEDLRTETVHSIVYHDDEDGSIKNRSRTESEIDNLSEDAQETSEMSYADEGTSLKETVSTILRNDKQSTVNSSTSENESFDQNKEISRNESVIEEEEVPENVNISVKEVTPEEEEILENEVLPEITENVTEKDAVTLSEEVVEKEPIADNQTITSESMEIVEEMTIPDVGDKESISANKNILKDEITSESVELVERETIPESDETVTNYSISDRVEVLEATTPENVIIVDNETIVEQGGPVENEDIIKRDVSITNRSSSELTSNGEKENELKTSKNIELPTNNNQSLYTIESGIANNADTQADITLNIQDDVSLSKDTKSSVEISTLNESIIDDIKNLSNSSIDIDDDTSDGAPSNKTAESINDGQQIEEEVNTDNIQQYDDDNESIDADDYNNRSTTELLNYSSCKSVSPVSVKHDESIEQFPVVDVAISMKRKDEETYKSEEETISDSSDRLDLSYGIVKEDKDEILSASSNDTIIEDCSSKGEERSLDELRVDVKKRVSELLADNNSYRSENSPRLQDIYCTTYDLNSPNVSPEPSPTEYEPLNKEILSAKFGDEAEELLKKQLAIEQEIKQLEQQQKEQIPYLYVREIPNKPPPPYTPPSSLTTSGSTSSTVTTTLPSNPTKIDSIIDDISDILYVANEDNRLETIVCNNEPDVKYLTEDITKTCHVMIFDLCKEYAIEHYKQFNNVDVNNKKPSWMIETKKCNEYLFKKKFDRYDLRLYLKKNVREMLGFDVIKSNNENENNNNDNDNKRRSNSEIIKWSHKKRDHVDELLINESQNEESEWTNYDYDELIVKNDLTNDILNILIGDTANVLNNILTKKNRIN